MLAKSRTSALIMVLAFILSWAAAYYPIFDRLGGGVAAPQPGQGSALTIVMALVLLFLMAIFVSRMTLVTSLGERGFGLGGLARWSVLGLLTGTATGFTYTGLQRWLGDSAGRAGLEPLIIVAIFFLLYWLVFQLSPLRLRTGGGDLYIPDRRMIWAVLALEALVILVGFILIATITPTPFWPAAYVNLGLGALNCTAADLLRDKPAGQKNLRLAGLFLILLGLLVSLFVMTGGA